MGVNVTQMCGGKRIKDATATHADVKNGKVFYNNDGRQVGTGNFLEEKMIQLTARQYNTSYNGYHIEYISTEGLVTSAETGYRSSNGDSITLQNAKFITGITVDGKYIPFSRSLDVKATYVIYDDNGFNLSLYISKDYEGIVTISYCEISISTRYKFILHYL